MNKAAIIQAYEKGMEAQDICVREHITIEKLREVISEHEKEVMNISDKPKLIRTNGLSSVSVSVEDIRKEHNRLVKWFIDIAKKLKQERK